MAISTLQALLSAKVKFSASPTLDEALHGPLRVFLNGIGLELVELHKKVDEMKE
jgi:hypothetical protein